MKIVKKSSCTFTVALVEGIKIGQIKLNAEIQVMTYADSDEDNFEVLDFRDVTYMGMEVEKYSELFNFHDKLGIDLRYEIEKSIRNFLTKAVVRVLVK